MTEDDIQQLLADGGGAEKISARIPKKLLDRMIAAYRKKVGAVREHGLTSQALFYFAARGVMDWEREYDELQRLRIGMLHHIKGSGAGLVQDAPKKKKKGQEP